jgi:hypothetical protein
MTLFGGLTGTSASFSSSVTGNTIVKSGGTSSQFLKADGSIDSNSYVTIDTTQTISGAKTFSSGIISTVADNSYFLRTEDIDFLNHSISNSIRIHGRSTPSIAFLYFGSNSGGNAFGFNGTNFQMDGDFTINGTATISSSATANSFIKSGGTSSQFLKANGTVDSSTYLTASSSSTNYVSKFTGASAIGDSLIFSNSNSVGIGTNTFINSVNMQYSLNSGASSIPDFGIFNTATSPTISASTRLSLGFMSGNTNYVPTGITLGEVTFYGQANDAVDSTYGGASINAKVTTGGNTGRDNHIVDLVFRTKTPGFTGVEDKMKLTGAGVLDLLYGQVKFPATQNASTNANTLDDYEEGTFTPTLGGSSTYSTQFGNYTKIGNRVYFKITFTVTTIGTGSAQTISGLPFTCDNTAVGYSIYVGAFQGLSTARVFMGGRVNGNSTDVAMRTLGAAAVGVQAANIFTDGSTIELGGFYGV